MEKLKEYWLVIIIAVTVLGLVFYWFEFRPSQIKKTCANGTDLHGNRVIIPESLYNDCLRMKGL